MRFAGLGLAALLGAAGAEAAQHEGLAAVKERGFLRVCADPSNLPYSSNDPATPGFEVELAGLIARELGVDARPEWNPTYVRALKPLPARSHGRSDKKFAVKELRAVVVPPAATTLGEAAGYWTPG